MALREILAQLDVQVRGADAVRTASADLTRYVGTLSPVATRLERLRIQQQQAAEMASRLGGRVRELQRAEGADARQIEELRLAQVRAQATAQSYGRAISTLEGQARELGTAFRGTTQHFGGQLFDREPQGLLSRQTLSSVRSGMLALAPAIAIAGAALYAIDRAAHEAWSQIRAVIAEGDQIGDSADRLGISAHAYQEWSYVAAQTGTSIETVGRAFPVLARNMLAGGHGATSAAGAFRELGVATRDAEGHARSQEAVFGDIIGALARVTNHTQQAALAQRIFGRSGAELLPLIRQAPGEVDRLRRRFTELGGGLSDDVVENADQADQALRDVDVALDGLRSELVAEFLPGVIDAARGIGTFVGGIVNAVRQSSTGVIAIEALRAAWVAFGPSIRLLLTPIAAAVLGFVLLFAVVEDFVTALRGGRSALGEYWKPLIVGMGEAQAAFREFDAEWNATLARLGWPVGAVPAAPAVAPAAPIVPAPPPAARGAGGGSTGATTVHAPTTIHIDGARDPEATARAVDVAMRRRHREFADTLAVAAPAGAGA